MEKVFAAGSMHELSGKKVEVKNATPKGSGPMGRTGLGRGALLPGRGFAIAGRPYPEFAQPGYGMAPGYQLAPGEDTCWEPWVSARSWQQGVLWQVHVQPLCGSKHQAGRARCNLRTAHSS